MALVNRSFSVRVTPGMMPPIVHVSEYDVGRAYTVSILDEQGNTFTIPSGTTATVEGTLNGSVGFTQSATVSNNQVSFTLSQSMTAYSGKAWCKIKLMQNSQPIQTCAFVLAVDRAGVEADTVIGASGFEQQIQGAVDNYLDEHPVGVEVDPTLTISGAAADAKATGNEIAKLENEIDDVQSGVFKTHTKTGSASIVLQAGEGIPATTKLLKFSVPANTTFSYRLDFGSGVSQIDAVYKIDINEARSAIRYEPTSGRVYTGTADTEISFFSVYIRGASISAETTVTMTVWYEIENQGSLEERIDEADERIDEAEESIENLNNLKLNDPYFEYNNDFVIGSATSSTSTDPTRAKTKPILGRGVLTVKNALSSGYIMALRVWSDAPYGTLVYDSGWKATNDFSYDVTGKYYVVSFYIRPDGTSNIDLTALANSDIKITEMSPDDTNLVVRLVADVSAINETLSGKVGYSDIQSETVRTIAHRGDDVTAPQNTAPAYIAARKRGIMTAENDLALSEDGQFVMWHDGDLSRFGNLVDINGYQMYTDGTNYYYVNNNSVYTWDGSQYVASSVALSSLTRCAGVNYSVNSANGKIGLNLDVLKRIDFGRYKGTQFVGTQILTFAEWVLLCKQLGMELYIDKKITLTDSLAQSAVTTVKRLGMAEKASWLNVGPAEVARIRTHDANARCGALMHPTSSLVEEYAPLNVGRGFFFDCNAKTMTREEVQIGLDAGFEVEAWYVDVTNVPEEQQLEVVRTSISYGVTAMTLDHIKVEDAFAYLLR